MNRKSKIWITVAIVAIVCGLTTFQNCGKHKGTTDEVLIGIAWRADTESEFYTNVVRAIEEAGGIPVMLDQVYPNGYTLEGSILSASYTDEQGILLQTFADEVKTLPASGSNVAAAVGSVSAVVFTGGEDISPTLMRTPEPWHGIEEEKDYNVTRDVSDYLTLAYCLEQDMPVMGMCRGMQMLSVVSGATLIQDIPTYFDGQGITYEFMHRNQCQPGQYRDYASHVVSVTNRESHLYHITATDTIIGVPSWHHQCVGSVSGTPLVVTGVTNTHGIDIIEAVERADKTFCVGLQFHPEAAIVKHLDHVANASQFMSYDHALLYFKELVRQAQAKK